MVSMKELTEILTDTGFKDVLTYLNSGNVILKSPLNEEELLILVETVLSKSFDKEIKVVIRSIGELENLLKYNPFPDVAGSKVGVLLVKEIIKKKMLAEFVTVGREKIVPGKREVYVLYPDGIGRSKLRFPPELKEGTMRNINTLTKLVGIVKKG